MERILPGADGRIAYLNSLNKDPLREELDLLESERAAIQQGNRWFEAELETRLGLDHGSDRNVILESLTELGITLTEVEVAEDPYHGLLPLVLHISGVEWANSQRRLVRCGTNGPLAELWLVQVGDRMFTVNGHSIPFKPYRHAGKSLQPTLGHTLEGGLRMLAKI